MKRRKKGEKTGGFTQSLLMKRILAFIIDLIIVNLVIVAPFSSYFHEILPVDEFSESYAYVQDQGLVSLMTPPFFFIIFYTFFYFVLLEYLIGRTVGKILFGLRVIGTKKDPGLFQCMVRSLFLLFFFPFSLFTFLDPIYYFFFSKKRQRLSEYLSQTYVVIEHA